MSNAPGILISMARCISRRTGQMLFTILATALIVTVIGSGIVRQSSRRIEARQTVLQEIGVTPWVPASHFIERTWFQDLTAGLFFGITLAPALGIAMFALCMLLESIPYFKLRIGAAALAILLLTVLSHRILRTGPAMPSCFVLILHLQPREILCDQATHSAHRPDQSSCRSCREG